MSVGAVDDLDALRLCPDLEGLVKAGSAAAVAGGLSGRSPAGLSGPTGRENIAQG